ncbi:hypothetical protein VNO77_25570 [Canavalia gladiata]|uniref:Uncharacterized protein n=1 Tax=Canavalia gladiata TaxID=3824 RepID=A0AAN9L8C8_CANGL
MRLDFLGFFFSLSLPLSNSQRQRLSLFSSSSTLSLSLSHSLTHSLFQFQSVLIFDLSMLLYSVRGFFYWSVEYITVRNGMRLRRVGFWLSEKGSSKYQITLQFQHVDYSESIEYGI